jgi:hypothetical protein
MDIKETGLEKLNNKILHQGRWENIGPSVKGNLGY